MTTGTPETDSHYYHDFEMGGDVVLADFARKLERERDEVRKQRDRLAEALKTIIRIYENVDKGCIPSSSDMYDEALQSLNQNADGLGRRTLDADFK